MKKTIGFKSSPKILVIVGPTSSGKSELAVKLARRFGGEIISCDSRQIYKRMDLGTGKINGRWHKHDLRGRVNRAYVYKSVVHHLIDFVSPCLQFSVSRFKALAQKAIADIVSRGKLPILCGGTMHWIDAVVYNQGIPDVKPNLKLRARLNKQPSGMLYRRLMKLDPVRAKSIDRHNKRRLIRALEIVITTGKPVPRLPATRYPLPAYDALWFGIKVPQKIIYKKIEKRLKQRIKAGMIVEIKNLHSPPLQGGVRGGLSWKRLESFGLEYRFISLFLQGKLSRNEMITKLSYAIKHYSKRQMTWWKRNKEIIWINNISQAKELVDKSIK